MHIEVGPTIEIDNDAATVTNCVVVVLQPSASVPVTVYVVFVVGVLVIELVVAPVFHEYVLAPLAVRLAVWPVQIPDDPEILTVGFWATVTVCEPELWQPTALEPVTV